jgi:hypothetical protein
MNVQMKRLRRADGNHLILIVSGLVHFNGVQLVLDRMIEASRQLLDCKVLLDFQDCTLRVLPSEFATLIKDFDFSGWPYNNTVVFVSKMGSEQYQQIAILAEGLASNRIRVAAFPNIKEAVDWLSNGSQRCS